LGQFGIISKSKPKQTTYDLHVGGWVLIMAKKIDDISVETFYPSEIVDIETLRPWPRNYKIHDDNQTGLLGQSLGDFGQAKNVVVWRGPGDDFDFIVAGHGLVSGAKAKGWNRVEVKRLPSEWSVVQIESYLVADNSLAELSKTDTEKLANILHSIRQENPRMLEPTGYDSEKVDAMLRELSGVGEPGGSGGLPTGNAGESNYKEQYGVIVICADESNQREVYETLLADGYDVKVVVT